MERQARRCFAVGSAQRNSAVMRHSARKIKLPTIAREASGRLSKLQQLEQARNPGREHPSRPSGPDVIISKNRIRNRSIERWQAAHFQLSKPDTKTRTAYNSSTGCGDGGKRNFRGPKLQLFLQYKGLFKASTGSLDIQLQAREKWRRCGNHNYRKLRLECTPVAINRNRSMASQRADTSPESPVLYQIHSRWAKHLLFQNGRSIDYLLIRLRKRLTYLHWLFYRFITFSIE